MERPTVYAIDFGTTNSLLAAASPHRVFEPIPLDANAPDPTVLRSVLFFPSAREVFYGERALREYAAHGMQGRLIRSIKKHLPSRAFIGTRIEERPMNLEDLIGAFLAVMRRRANAHFGVDVTRVVLGRPALFSEVPEDDRFAEYRLERAARIAGFEDVSFCPEPVAAAASFRERLPERRLVLVGDFGGGTSDFTCLWLGPEPFDPSHVLAIGGVSVAGDALDGSIMRARVARHFGAEVRYRVPMGANLLEMPSMLRARLCSPADLSILSARDVMAHLRDIERWSLGPDDRRRMEQLFVLIEDAQGFALFEAIERAKRELSRAERAEIAWRYPPIDLREPIDRASFRDGARRELGRILDALDDTLLRAGVGPRDVDVVCLTGGTARVPALAEELAARFGEAKLTRARAFHSVIDGLARRAQAVA